jgi:tetratricopeptide (TPR) repeat protein
VKGRVLAVALVLAFGIALLGQTVRLRDRLLASGLLRQVEILSAAVAAGRAPRQAVAANLQALRRAAELDPMEVRIPNARAAQYLLLGNPQEAVAAYREALALEPHPEMYFNLGRAYLAAGQAAAARENFARAVRLDPRLAAQVPAVR